MVFFTLLSDDLHAAFIQDVATAKPIKKRRSILKRYFILFFGECAHVRSLSWGEAVVRGCRGAVPSGEHFPPREARVPPAPTRSPPPSLPAWSFIIYGRDKIKQTQQNSVKSECRRFHIYTLSCGGGRGQSRAEFVQLLVPASQHPSAGRSQVETLY